MMSTPIVIRHDDILIAKIFPSSLTTENVEFYSDDEESFQVGIHVNKKGDILNPHIHSLKDSDHLKIKDICELVYVQYGDVLVKLYTEGGEFLSDHSLKEHDSIVFYSGGHGVEFLQDSKIFMIKQGPFTYTKHSKLKISS